MPISIQFLANTRPKAADFPICKLEKISQGVGRVGENENQMECKQNQKDDVVSYVTRA